LADCCGKTTLSSPQAIAAITLPDLQRASLSINPKVHRPIDLSHYLIMVHGNFRYQAFKMARSNLIFDSHEILIYSQNSRMMGLYHVVQLFFEPYT